MPEPEPLQPAGEAISARPVVLRPSLESRIGSQWFNRVGIVAVLIGVAWFLKYAVDQHWLGASGRIVAGLVAGLALIAWSERFRVRGFPVFAFSLKAVGTGMLYLALWASSVLFHLVPYQTALAGMALVTAGNAWLCMVQRSELLAAFALTGGFLTPALLGFEQGSVGTLGAYLILLNGGLFALLTLRRWPRLLPAALAGTICYLLRLGWDAAILHQLAGQTSALALAAFFFGLFSLASIFLVSAEDRGLRAGSVTAAANAVLGGLSLWTLLRGYALRPWTACLEATWLGLLLAWGPLRRPGRSLLAQVHTVLVIVLAAVGMWMALPPEGAILGWLLQAAVLLLLSLVRGGGSAGAVLGSPAPSAALLLLGGCTLVGEAVTGGLPAALHLLLNVRFGLFAVGVSVAGMAVRIAALQHAHSHTGSIVSNRPVGRDRDWGRMGAGSAVLATVLLLLAGIFEMHTYWGTTGWGADDAMAERFAVSAWAALLGLGLLVIGFRVRWAFLRWQALALLTLAIGKVFLVDTRALTQGYRILSFLGLGILLLAVSFIYQRDLLNLRGKEHGGE